jgi:hypothetical protein
MNTWRLASALLFAISSVSVFAGTLFNPPLKVPFDAAPYSETGPAVTRRYHAVMQGHAQKTGVKYDQSSLKPEIGRNLDQFPKHRAEKAIEGWEAHLAGATPGEVRRMAIVRSPRFDTKFDFETNSFKWKAIEDSNWGFLSDELATFPVSLPSVVGYPKDVYSPNVQGFIKIKGKRFPSMEMTPKNAEIYLNAMGPAFTKVILYLRLAEAKEFQGALYPVWEIEHIAYAIDQTGEILWAK